MNLNEWKDSNGNKVNTPKAAATSSASTTTSFKKRFEKLIKYHIDHASSELESITKKDIKDDGFHLTEHYNNGHHEFDRDIIVSYDKDSNTFMLRIFVDSKTVNNILCNGYEDFVTAAEGYMFLPDYNTPEYDDLLVEWVDKTGKKVSTSSTPSASSTPAQVVNDYTDKFKNLCKHLTDVHGQVEITYLEPHRFSGVIKNKNGDFLFALQINQLAVSKRLRVSLYATEDIQANNIYMKDWDFLLDQLLSAGIIKDKSLCESAPTSIADDFKLYENLWD